MELLMQLELVDVSFEDSRANLIFLHAERGEIREISLNKAVYNADTKKFVKDDVKAEKVEKMCKDIFNLTFDTLAHAIGEKHDIYAYDTFNSLYEVEFIEKFTKDEEGLIFETTVSKIHDDGKAIHIEFDYEGKTYESKMSYADYMESRNEWFTNPIKKKKQYSKFAEKFHIDVENMHELLGRKIMCEVKVAFSKFPYVEIKPFPKKKK